MTPLPVPGRRANPRNRSRTDRRTSKEIRIIEADEGADQRQRDEPRRAAMVNKGTKEARNEAVVIRATEAASKHDQFNERCVMKINRSVKLVLATGCCLALAPVVNANPRHVNSSMGNSAFGQTQRMSPQIGSGNSGFGRMTAQEAQRKRKIGSRNLATTRHARTKHGNSAFGHRQGDANTRTTGSQNNAYGQRAAAHHRSHSPASHSSTSSDTDVSAATMGAPGNSAFGHQQGDATTRTTGSQNNAYGKAQSAAAQAKHDRDNDNATLAPTPSPDE